MPEVQLPSGVSEAGENFQPAGMDTATASNAAATATRAAVAGKSHFVTRITAGFSGTAPGTQILCQLKDGTTVIGNYACPATGVLDIRFERPVQITAGNACSLVLAAGGSGAVGNVTLNSFLY